MKKLVAISILTALVFSFASCKGMMTGPEIQPKLLSEISTSKNEYAKSDSITVNYSVSPDIMGGVGTTKDEITESSATIYIRAFGFLITCGEESARSYLQVEVPQVHTVRPNEETANESDMIYELCFDGSFTLSDYKSEDSLGFVDFHTSVDYTAKNRRAEDPEYTYQSGYSSENSSLSITEVGDGLRIGVAEDVSELSGYGKSMPPQLCTNLDGENHNYKTALTSFDYSWRGWERREDETIVERGISSDATGFFEIFNSEKYRHDITEYEVKRVYSTDLSGGDVREERYEHIIHDGFFDIFREHKNYVTFTPQQNRIFVFEIEYEYGVATYKIKLLEFGYDSLS